MRLPTVRFIVEGTIVVVAMLMLAAFDRSFYLAYQANWVGRTIRGLAAWGNPGGSGVWEESSCYADIHVLNVASLSAILLALWVARRTSRGRAGALVRVAVVLILLLVALSLLCLPHMLDVIMGHGPPG